MAGHVHVMCGVCTCPCIIFNVESRPSGRKRVRPDY